MSRLPTDLSPNRPCQVITLLMTLFIMGLCGLGIHAVLKDTTLKEGARLQAIADLQARQVADWLRERQGVAELVRTSPSLLEESRLWLIHGDLAAATRMQARLARFPVFGGFQAIELYDLAGQPIWSTEGTPHITSPELERALSEAQRTRHIQRVDPHLDSRGRVHLAYVVPLATDQAGGSPLVVLHTDTEDWLCPTLRTWPSLSDSGETFLFRRDGEQVLYLCPLRHVPNAALRLRLPVTSERLLAARLLRGEAQEGDLIEGVDYRGVPALGVARSIAGTDWQVIAKLDLAEVRASVMPEIALIGLAGVLLLATWVTGTLVLLHRQQLVLATATQETQMERLRALSLLATLADSSEDAIFAKDLEGRYTLINPSAARYLGLTPKDALGRTDQDLMPPAVAAQIIDDDRRTIADDAPIQVEETLALHDGPCTLMTTKGPLRDTSGRVIGVFGIARDISARKAMESQLKLWSDAFERSELNLAMGDPVNQRILAVNPAFARRRGYRPEEMVGMPIISLFPADRLEEVLAQVREADATGHRVCETEHLCRDGERFPVLLDITVTQAADGTPAMRIVYAQDIGARVAAEAARRESEARLREAQRIAGLGHWEWDLRTDRHLWSEEVYQLYGRDPTLSPARYPEVSQYFTPESWSDLTQAIEKALAEGDAYQCDAEVVRPDGSHRWVTARGETVRDQAGQPILLRGTVQDITARKEAELALHESRQRFQDIVDASADWVWEIDTQNHYIYASDGVQAMLGYSPEEVLGRLPFDFMPPAEAARVAAEFVDIVARRTAFRDLENINQHKDGRLLHIHTTGLPILGNDGELLGYRGLDRDVTEKRRAEIALQESRELLRTLVRNIPDLVWLKDQQGAFMTCNARFESLLGATEPQIIGKTDYDFVPRELADLFRANDLAAMAAHGPHMNEEELTFASDGHQELVQVIKTPMVDAHGAVIGVLGIGRDITQLKRTEVELEHHRHHLEDLVAARTAELREARAEAERLARAKGEFLANMSHEIRTPMNAVLGLAFLLERQELPASARELARKIHQSGRSLLGIINDILDYSKIESGHVEIEHAPFRLKEVLDNLATIMTATVAEKALELVIKPPDCIDCTLAGDALRLGQILVNLTGNAIKFTPSGVVEVGIDTLRHSASQIDLRFSVRDTGIGIEAATQARLFQPFAQADASTTRRFGGSGLGLAISRRLVELMGGHLGLDSTPGLGSTFWFELSFDIIESAPDRKQAERMRVLIADDNPIVCSGVAATVAALGWSSSEVTSGQQALRRVLHDTSWQGPDAVVLLDWQMPGLDGLATANAIRQALPAAAHPLLFLLTAHALTEVQAAANAGAVDTVLLQPLTPSSLLDAVNRERQRRLGDLACTTPATTSERRLAGLRLLVVDDSDINREVAGLILADEGAEVHLAIDGQDAVDWLIAHPDAVDLVLMDVQMPVMDGLSATRVIRQTPGIATLPVVALTADALSDQESAALEAGMNAFLTKPFDVPEAVALIRELAHHRTLPHPGGATPTGGASNRHQDVPAVMDAARTVPVEPSPAPPVPSRAPESSPPKSGPDAAQNSDLPGIDIDTGLAIWEEPNLYRQYLRRFARDYADSAHIIAQAEPDKARQLAHKLKGTAGTLGLTEVSARAGELEQALASGSTVSVTPLQDALASTLASIARYAPDGPDVTPAPAPELATTTTVPRERVIELLRAVLNACEGFDPPAAGPPLEALAACLPAARLAPLRQAIDAFDAHAGAAAVRALAESLAIGLED